MARQHLKRPNKPRRATLYRRRGTPAQSSHFGVPLEHPGVARQPMGPWQMKGVTRQSHGVARW
ncbi:hypothetical protein AHAS_Ahas07G0074600 [Arachis hypogaea]